MICTQPRLCVKIKLRMEDHAMRNHLLHSRKYLAASLCFLFFAVSLLTFPVQTTAQTRSSQRERRVQIFFAYNPTRPAAGQEVQFQDFSRGNPTSWLWDFGDGQTSILQNPRHAYATPGSYKVIMTARNNISSGRVSRTLNVILSTSASFTYGPAYPVTGQAVQFTDTSTGGPTSCRWDFGDSTTSTSQNPSHTYTTAGSYTVTLTVGFSSGSKTVSQTITVTPALVASFTYSPSSPVAGQAVQFTDTSTGSPTSWQWSSGDGATSTSQNPSHTYAAAGSYTVTLTVGYSSGSRSASQTINVLPPPALTASFTYSPSSPVAGQAVQFTDTSTGGPTSWLWNFGDSTTSTSKSPSHTYAAAGSYTVTLTATNSTASKSVSQTITVSPASTLTASFTYSPSSPVAGQSVQFTDTSTGGPTSWQWNFGDSTSSTSQNPSHSYATAASYTVTLTVANSSASKSASQTITVSPASTLTASFIYSPSSPAAGQVVYFTDTSTGSPTSWLWNFGDSATSTFQNSSHSYATAASYTVALTIANSSGSKSASQTVTVLPAFAASFTYSPSSPAAGQAVQFTDTSTGSPTSWQWNFGDSATSTIQNPTHTYAAAGSYWVNLIITKGADSQSTSQMITVRPPGVITAASPSYADVSAAVSSAVSGDTIIVPAGTAVWNNQLFITKGIKLIGAGIGNTIVTCNFTVPSAGERTYTTSYLIAYQPSHPELNEPFRLSGFTLDCGAKCLGIFLNNNTQYAINRVRIDHNRVFNTLTTGTGAYETFGIYGRVWGVADNNILDGSYNSVDGYDGEWNIADFNFGTADMFYFENNTFIGRGHLCIRSEMGARWCSRYNIYDGTNRTTGLYPWHDQHGNNALGGWHSVMGCEIYGNTVNIPSYGVNITQQRGGKMMCFNNTVNADGAICEVREEYLDSVLPPATSPNGQPQHVSDSYYWNNLINGQGTSVAVTINQSVYYGGDIGLVPQANRDYWFQSATFNGTAGIGVGLLSARPATCTKGVAYWATDTNTLYKATATNTWTAYYTPYTYPHPLRSQL